MMEKFIWTLDENLKLMVSIIGKFLAFLALSIISTEVFSHDGQATIIIYVSMLFAAIIVLMLVGITIWFVWATRNYSADRYTALIMSTIATKVFAAYFVTFGLIISAIKIAVVSGYTQQPAAFLGIAFIMLIGWKIDSYLDDYLCENIFDDLQT